MEEDIVLGSHFAHVQQLPEELEEAVVGPMVDERIAGLAVGH